MIDLATGNPTAGAPLGEILSLQAACTPDSPAVTFGGVTTSFAELDGRANRRARMMSSLGVVQGDVVVIALPNSLEFFETSYAIWKLGAIPCPVSPKLAENEFREILALAKPRLVIGKRLQGSDCVMIEAGVEPGASMSSTPLPPLSHAPGRIATSGGSTGRPKLIIDPQPSIWGADKDTVRRPPRCVVLNPGPLYHSAPFSLMLMALAQGSHVVCMDRFDPIEWLHLAEAHKVEWAYLVPTMMARIAKLPVETTAKADLTSIRTVLHMAAPCPQWVKRWWIERLGADTIWEVYGGTERIGATTIGGEEWLLHPGSVGKARPGQAIVILDDNGCEVAPMTIGEIHFRNAAGPGAGYSYIGTETRIKDDLDSFGDMGWVDEAGYLFIADRRTDMIIVGGVNIWPAEVESVIEALPDVIACAVIGLPDEDLGNRLHAIIELLEGQDIPSDPASYLATALQHLASLKRPRSFEFVDQPLRDPAGKIRRSGLRAARVSAAAIDQK